MEVNWKKEAEKRREAYLEKTTEFLSIPSVHDESSVQTGAPFGKPVAEALDYILEFCEESGFTTHNVDGYAAHAEYGTGEDIIGVLCHIDVVPAGDGWTSDPFMPEVREGKLFARGAIDDKGPTMAAIFALKIIKECGLPLNKRVRLIFGTDEESGDWAGLRKYFSEQPMPVMGFAPDANFPIITAEKGILICHLVQEAGNFSTARQDGWTLTSFHAGDRVNMVADKAEATLSGDGDVFAVKERFQSFLMEHHIRGYAEEQSEHLQLKLEGISHHGMEPHKGLNAGLALARFLHVLDLDERGSQFIGLIHDYFVDSFFGEKLDIAIEDDVNGKLTVNLGTFAYEHDGRAELGVNIRYPVKADADGFMGKVKNAAQQFRFDIAPEIVDQKPHYVEENHVLVQTLKKVYEDHTGEEAILLSIGGGTYGRALDTGVAFGPLFPGEAETAHQKDEYLDVKNMTKAMAIYAQAIYELAK